MLGQGTGTEAKSTATKTLQQFSPSPPTPLTWVPYQSSNCFVWRSGEACQSWTVVYAFSLQSSPPPLPKTRQASCFNPQAAGLPARWCFKGQQWSKASPNHFASESISITPSPPCGWRYRCIYGYWYFRVICLLCINEPKFLSRRPPVIINYTICTSEDEDEDLLPKRAEAGLKTQAGPHYHHLLSYFWIHNILELAISLTFNRM